MHYRAYPIKIITAHSPFLIQETTLYKWSMNSLAVVGNSLSITCFSGEKPFSWKILLLGSKHIPSLLMVYL